MMKVSIWLQNVEFSNLLESALVYGSHIIEAYSMPERTGAGEPLKLRLTNPSFLAAFVDRSRRDISPCICIQSTGLL